MPEYVEVLRTAFVNMWASVVVALPKLLVALAIFLIGLLVANILQTAVIRLIRFLKVDELVNRLDIKPMFQRVGLKLDVAEILGWIVKWFIIIMALIAAADALQWDQITVFLSDVVAYIPNVIIAVVILLVGLVLASFVRDVIRGAVQAANMKSADFLAGVAKWSIIVFSVMAALVQLGIAQSLIQTLFTGFVAMIALAGGLAFGLGGREHASKVLDHLYHDLRSKR